MIILCIMIVFSYMYNQIILLVLSAISLLVNAIMMLIIMSIDMFRRDKILDIEALKKQGLTIISCKECGKENVLEDIFCIFCGDRLGEENEQI